MYSWIMLDHGLRKQSHMQKYMDGNLGNLTWKAKGKEIPSWHSAEQCGLPLWYFASETQINKVVFVTREHFDCFSFSLGRLSSLYFWDQECEMLFNSAGTFSSVMIYMFYRIL